MDGSEVPPEVLIQLAAEVDAPPGPVPRLSISLAPRPCAPFSFPARPASADDHCERKPARRLASITRWAAASHPDHGQPLADHVLGLIDLLDPGAGGNRLDLSISSLGAAADKANFPSPARADLAAAYMTRAERNHAPRDLIAALDAAEFAVRADRYNRVALFNRALALQRLGLAESAMDAWRAYLAADSVSAWAEVARRSVRAGVPARPSAPAPGAPASTYAAFAAEDAQGGRELGWCRVLGAWAGAALAEKDAIANSELDRAQALGEALRRRPGGDASLADAVQALRAARAPGTVRRLAEAHLDFAEGCAMEREARFAPAAEKFSAARSRADGSPALADWSRLMWATSTFFGGDRRREAPPVFTELGRRVDAARYPALAGRAALMLSVVHVRADRSEEAQALAIRAGDLFRHAGERENEGVALTGLSAARFALLDLDGGYEYAVRALERLQPYRDSYRLHNILSALAEEAGADGFFRAALRLQDEDVRVAGRAPDAVSLAEAWATRGLLRAAGHDVRGAEADEAAVRAAIAALPASDSTSRGWLTSELQALRAAGSLRASPLAAARGLDSAAAFFLGRRIPLRALPFVVNGARARLRAGDAAGGAARLDTSLAILERRRDEVRMEPRRAAVFEQAREVVDQLTMLRLAAGDTAGALARLDRGRASLASTGARVSGRGNEVSAPAGEIAVVYAMIGDTLLAWTVQGRRVRLARAVVDTVELSRTVDGLRARMEARAGDAEVKPALERLHARLIRPLDGRLGAPGTPLVIVADGVLAGIPFAALYDHARGRYLVQDHPVRSAASLRQAALPPHRVRTGGTALFITDPAFDVRVHGGFPRLGATAEEARRMAQVYPRRRVLNGAAADPASVRAALGAAPVVHYAGHAVFDDERPERSYLLLAGSAPGTLTALEIAEMDLRGVSLVVLAACQTVRTGPGRAAGFSGLSGAFLAAGAGGALGSLWVVDDRFTSRLMAEFHREYRERGNGPESLRQAQLTLLRSGDAALRSPAAWAGFRYAGS